MTYHAEAVLWGHCDRHPIPIKLTGGTLAECVAEQRTREAQGWRCAIYRKGAAPTALRHLAGLPLPTTKENR